MHNIPACTPALNAHKQKGQQQYVVPFRIEAFFLLHDFFFADRWLLPVYVQHSKVAVSICNLYFIMLLPHYTERTDLWPSPIRALHCWNKSLGNARPFTTVATGNKPFVMARFVFQRKDCQ